MYDKEVELGVQQEDKKKSFLITFSNFITDYLGEVLQI